METNREQEIKVLSVRGHCRGRVELNQNWGKSQKHVTLETKTLYTVWGRGELNHTGENGGG
jgi:hypothetical protein